MEGANRRGWDYLGGYSHRTICNRHGVHGQIVLRATRPLNRYVLPVCKGTGVIAVFCGLLRKAWIAAMFVNGSVNEGIAGICIVRSAAGNFAFADDKKAKPSIA